MRRERPFMGPQANELSPDCTAADGLLDRLLAAEILHGDKG
jgi:hypothetical protein